MYNRGYAPIRKTEIGSMIESFMDDNTDHISPTMWDLLDQLGKEIDNAVEELEKHIDDLNSQIED
jgi:hypothetical protein